MVGQNPAKHTAYFTERCRAWVRSHSVVLGRSCCKMVCLHGFKGERQIVRPWAGHSASLRLLAEETTFSTSSWRCLRRELYLSKQINNLFFSELGIEPRAPSPRPRPPYMLSKCFLLLGCISSLFFILRQVLTNLPRLALNLPSQVYPLTGIANVHLACPEQAKLTHPILGHLETFRN